MMISSEGAHGGTPTGTRRNGRREGWWRGNTLIQSHACVAAGTVCVCACVRVCVCVERERVKE